MTQIPFALSKFVRPLLVGLLVGTMAIAVGEWAVIQPRAERNRVMLLQLDALRGENRRAEDLLADYKTFKHSAEEVEREYTAALDSVPTEAELAGALKDIETVTEAAGVSLVRFTPETKKDASAVRPAASKGGASPAPVITTRPISVVVRCGFADYQSLLGRLATYPRLLTVEGFRMRSANCSGYTIEASISLNCYYKPTTPEAANKAGGR